MLKTSFMKYRISVIAFATLSLFSCKKDKTEQPINPTPSTKVYEDYTAVKQGNYWIYQHYTLDSIDGAAYAENSFDSCYVVADTIINGKTYHHTITANISQSSLITIGHDIFRDSLSYVVNYKSDIQFSSEDFGRILRSFTYGPNYATSDTMHVTEIMGFINTPINVPAGTFTTSSFRRIFSYKTVNKKQVEYRYSYAKNIGLVRYTTGTYFGAPMVLENRLVRYSVR